MKLSLKERATKEALDRVYMTSMFGIGGHFVVALLISILLIDKVSLTINLFGFISHTIILAGRAYSVFKYIKIKESLVEVNSINNWLRIYKIGAFLTGLLWGLTLFFLYDLPIEYHFIVFALVIGLAAAGLVTLGMVLSIYISFMLPMLGFTTLWMLLQNDKTYTLVGLLTVVGMLYFIFIARRIAHNFYQVFMDKEVLKEHIRREKELQLQYKQQAQIIQQVKDSVISTDLNGNIVSWNNGAEKMLGFTANEIIGKNMSIIHRPEDIEQNREYANRLIASGAFEVDVYLIKKSKDLVYASISLSLLRDEYGNITGLIGVSHDITQRKKAEDDLATQYNLIHNIIDHMPLRIFWKDRDLFYLGANKLLLEDVKLDSIEDIIGKNDFELPWEKKQAQICRDNDMSVISSGIAQLNFEEIHTNKDGESVVLLKSLVPLKDLNGNTIGVLGSYENITSKRNMENKLIQQSRLAQMGELISMIAHQWRQPLTAISATSINMQTAIELEEFDLETKEGIDKLNEYFLERLENINHFVQNLTTTIDDFRNFYKPDKKSVMTKLEDIILKSLSIIKTSLINDNIEIIEQYNSKEEMELYDKEMMQVILNILKNAQDNFKERDIKKPKIVITTTKNSMSICDNGGGIPEDILEKIFHPYFSTKDEKNGTGLGLYMSKIIVEEHHNAKLIVENKNGGVCFSIKLGEIKQ